MRYIYSLIRFVPNPGRGEFINVGVIVGSDGEGEWQSYQVENLSRARAIDEDRAIRAVPAFISKLEETVAEHEWSRLIGDGDKINENWLRELANSMNRSIQLTAPLPVLADCVEGAISTIAKHSIINPITAKRSVIPKTKALGALRRELHALNIRAGSHYREKGNLTTGNHQQEIDVAICNGRALQLTQAWSFKVTEEDTLRGKLRSWAYTVSAAQQGGGKLVTKSAEYEITNSTQFESIFVPPESDKTSTAFVEAQDIFRELSISPTPMSDAKAIANRAKELLNN